MFEIVLNFKLILSWSHSAVCIEFSAVEFLIHYIFHAAFHTWVVPISRSDRNCGHTSGHNHGLDTDICYSSVDRGTDKN
jgi:hypothetical protein